MHALVGIAIVAGLMSFAFGETVARIFVAGLLAVAAAFTILIAYIVVLDNSRQAAVRAQPQIIHMEAGR